ncbi:MAG: phosphoribosylformylglycinamidine synthase, partial [Selenomonadaceae bacterium]|nr:phosphoribosylformylglycinamidine synthase [Selenomonadaceae bacterium]
MSVRRIFVEKRSGFDVPAQQLLDDLRETFGVGGLRLFQRYDIEGLDDEEFAAVKDIVFSEPNVDRLTEELPTIDNAKLIAIEYLPGQFDQRADSAAQCCQLITGRERPIIRSARIVALIDFEGELEPIKHYLINAIESREASTELPSTLKMISEPPPDVEIISTFNLMDGDELKQFLIERGFAMSLDDLKFCQKYFRDEERRPPTITELRVIDTYWSDHCRHTTFNTAIDEINFETDEHFDQFYLPPLLNAYKLYINERQKIYGTDKRDITLMDIGTIAAKSLKYDGLLTALDKSEEINACSIMVQAEVDGRTEDWLVMFKNETHNHPTEIE